MIIERLDPELRRLAALLPALDLSDVTRARAAMAEVTASLPSPDLAGVDVADGMVPGTTVPVRSYTPAEPESDAAILSVHGGGFVMGDLETDHARNTMLARRVGVRVVAVDYRLAPEHRFPAGLDDCAVALAWIAGQHDRVALHGISAGGGLCAALTLRARDEGGPAIAFTYLGTPELDDRLDTPSMRAFTDTPMWNRAAAEASWDHYLGPGRRGGADVPAYAAPARAGDLR